MPKKHLRDDPTLHSAPFEKCRALPRSHLCDEGDQCLSNFFIAPTKEVAIENSPQVVTDGDPDAAQHGRLLELPGSVRRGQRIKCLCEMFEGCVHLPSYRVDGCAG
jgi:hypothetical protein